jgi:hypothetical protein
MHLRLFDTGIWRSIGQHMVEKEEVFLTNYSDGLSDVPARRDRAASARRNGRSRRNAPAPAFG